MPFSYLPRLCGLRCLGAVAAMFVLVTVTSSAAVRERQRPVAPPPGPTLDDIVNDMQKPLPAMQELDPGVIRKLNDRVDLAGDEHQERIDRAFAYLWFAALTFAVWMMRRPIIGLFVPGLAESGQPRRPLPPAPAACPARSAETRKPAATVAGAPAPARQFVRVYPVSVTAPTAPPAEPAVAPESVIRRRPAEAADVRRQALTTFVQVHLAWTRRESEAAQPRTPSANPPLDGLTKEEIEHYRTVTEFRSWVEFLTAARCGNRIAKEALAFGPQHAAVTFPLTSADIKTYLAYARHTAFSRAWMEHLLALLRESEIFDDSVVVTSPLGQTYTIPLTASSTLLNQVLGYESLPDDVRSQLELRRWILVHTRVDGTEQPEILTGFRAAATA